MQLEATIAISEVEPDRDELVPILVDGIDCEDRNLRYAAIEALRRVARNTKAYLPRIIKGLDNSSDRSNLISILAELGPDAVSAIPSLIKMLRDQEAGDGVPFSLGRIGPEAIPPLMKAMRDRDLLIRSRAIRALGYMGDNAKQFIPMFIGFLSNGSPVLRIAAADALGSIGPQAANALPALRFRRPMLYGGCSF